MSEQVTSKKLAAWPERIWLTRDAECVDGGCSGPCDATHWCQDKVNEHDVEYIRADEIDRLREDVSRYESGRVFLTGMIDDLKQKLAFAEDAAAKGDLARANAGGMEDRIKQLELAERLNVETVVRLQQERDRLAGQVDAAEQHVKILREERYSQPPADALAIVIRLAKWNTAYPKGQIYNSTEWNAGEAELDAICKDAELFALSTLPIGQPSTKEGDGYGHCPECRAVPGTCVHSAIEKDELCAAHGIRQDDCLKCEERAKSEREVFEIVHRGGLSAETNSPRCEACENTRVVYVDDAPMPCNECCCHDCGVAPGVPHYGECVTMEYPAEASRAVPSEEASR